MLYTVQGNSQKKRGNQIENGGIQPKGGTITGYDRLRLRYHPDKGFLACLGTFQVSAFLEKTKCLAFKTMSSMLKNRFKMSLKLNKHVFLCTHFVAF